MPNAEEHASKYGLDPRSTEELISFALSTDPDNPDFWDAVWPLQYRLLEIFPWIESLAASQAAKAQDVAATILGQNIVRDKALARECSDLLTSMLGRQDVDNTSVLNSIILALGNLKEPGFIDAVLPYQDHSNPDIRYAVTSALSACPDDRAIDALVTLSRDSDHDIRNWATFGLGSLIETNTGIIRAALVDRLAETDDEIRGEALVGLVLRRDARAIAPLRKELPHWSTHPLIKDCADELLKAKADFDGAWEAVFADLHRLGLKPTALHSPDSSG